LWGLMQLGQIFRGAAILPLLLVVTEAGAAATVAPGVAVVRTAAGAPGDATREGAAELMVLLEVARLRQQSSPPGLVAVGDRRGLFPAGAEEALRLAVLRGVPVVKLARGGRVLPAPHGLFLDGGELAETEAAAVLARCLQRHGTLPARDPVAPDGPVAPELRERLRLFQHELTLAASTRLAGR
jgi:hypothetical protein